jgi:drug/metabolite transporter (DMT)-like permease
MRVSEPPSTWQITVVLGVGILAASTAAILIRLAMVTAGTAGVGFSLVLAASRLSLAAIALLPGWRPLDSTPTTPAALRYACAAGLMLAIHFASWITSLSYTSIAASTTLVTTNPIWIALLSWVWFREKPGKWTIAGIGIALSGGLTIGLGGTHASTGSHPLLGDTLALVGAWTASLYFLLGREAQRRGLPLGSYITAAYSVAAIALLPLPLLLQTPYTGYPAATYGYILLLALLPQLVGHTSFNWAVRWASPTLVALVILFEPVISSLLGYWLFGETPGTTVLLGAILLLLGVAVAALHQGKEQ